MQFVAENPGVCNKLVLLASASTRGYPFYGRKADGQPDFENRLTTYEEVKLDVGKTKLYQTAYKIKDRELFKNGVGLAYIYEKPTECREI